MIGALTTLVLAGLLSTAPCDAVLTGRILDTRTDQPLARARITAGDGARPVRSDAAGLYRLEGLCSGPLTLTIVRPRYGIRVLDMTVEGEQTLDIKLAPIEVTQGEDVRVHAPRLKGRIRAPSYLWGVMRFSRPEVKILLTHWPSSLGSPFSEAAQPRNPWSAVNMVLGC